VAGEKTAPEIFQIIRHLFLNFLKYPRYSVLLTLGIWHVKIQQSSKVSLESRPWDHQLTQVKLKNGGGHGCVYEHSAGS